jgi:hypothetical protein
MSRSLTKRNCLVRHYFRTSFHTSRSDGGVLGAGSPLVRVLDSEMTQATGALDRDEIARPRARVAEGIEDSDAGAEQRRGLGGWFPILVRRERVCVYNTDVGVPQEVRKWRNWQTHQT